jgi:3-methyladenine DNA glycosylase AlkD
MSGGKGIETLYHSIVKRLIEAGKVSSYISDADEPDPRYKAYGVRAKEKCQIIQEHAVEIGALSQEEKLALARKLIESEYGEQQSVALYLLEQIVDYFRPGNFELLDEFINYLHGWSKIDGYTGEFLGKLLARYPDEVIELARNWNQSEDLWQRRASVVLFTRQVAKSGQYNDIGLELCQKLIWDAEDMVQKGVGWALKDMMRSDKERIKAYVKELRAQGVSSVITLYAIRDLKGEERAEVLRVRQTRK